MAQNLQKKIKPQEKIIEICIYEERENIESIITRQILNDFVEFNKNNELIKCSMKQGEIISNSIDVLFKTKTTYNFSYLNQKRIQSDFDYFAEFNKDDICYISKIEYEQDNKCIVEYSIPRKYILNFIFSDKIKTDN